MKKEHILENFFQMTYEPYIVGKKSNSPQKNFFPTIFSALNNLGSRSLIKINPGVYEERFKIEKPDLKVQASELTQNTILINRQYPSIIVELPTPTCKIIFQSLKIAHICEINPANETGRQRDHESLKKHSYQSFKTHEGMNTCIYIKKGIMQLDECKVSLAAYHRKQSVAACIVVEKQGCLILNRSEVIGGQGTIGVLCKGGRLIIKESTISRHGSIGVLGIGNKETSISIKNSNFSMCNEGIVFSGPFESLVENTTINLSIETGLVLCTGNVSKIYNNQIKNGEGNGIELKNCLPSILKNVVTHNLRWGIVVSSTSGIICKCVLKFNTVSQNNKGGVVLQGSVNVSQLHNNEISYNNKVGIRVENRASPHFLMNKILNTLGVGIYVTQQCSAFLQKNTIDASLKSNLVLEGPNNIANCVLANKITNSRTEGIFMIHCEKFIIKSNEIENNFNGIVSMTGVVNIEGNIIRSNERNGILLIRDNNVQILANEICHNKKAGLFIRDTSTGEIKHNYLMNNRSQIVIENDSVDFDGIQQTNKFGSGDLRIPSNYSCQII